MKRDPLAKEKFLEGVRQKWFAVVLAFALALLAVDSFTEVDPSPYLNFLTITTPVFIGALTVSSYNKEKAASLKKI